MKPRLCWFYIRARARNSMKSNGSGIMGLSIRQIADLAGVSRGTVDRALNNRPGINPQVKAKILALAAETGFRTNRAGKILGIRKTPLTIGIQMPSIGNEFFREVRCGIDRAAAELADYGLTLSIREMKGFSVGTQITQIRSLLAEGVNGLALAPVDHPDVIALLEDLAAARIPVMTMNTDIAGGPRLGYVGNDYTRSGAIAAGILGLMTDGRPLRTLIVTGSKQVLGHNQRISGFCQAIRQRYPQISILDILENQDDDRRSGQIVREALARWPEIDAIYLTAAGVAGACQACQEFAGGRQIERQVRIVCNDQTPGIMPYLLDGTIAASIGQEPFRQGYEPVRLLFEYLLDGTLPPPLTLTRNEIMIYEHFFKEAL
ncbi:MAG TPA: transcriptional regulator [Clostridiales bacterium]|nr:transcriptional regulator [Clostridiales bacterium]